jgi:hypothetical protein
MLWRNTRKTKVALLLGSTLVLLTTAYVFFCGRLLPFSPLVVGFSRHERDAEIIYLDAKASFDNFDMIDRCILEVEHAHGLSFKHKPEIFLLKTPATFARVTGSTVRFKTFPGYGRVFVSPRALEEADKGVISLPIYLKHELSHSLLFQHMTLYRSIHYPSWLLEGVATQSSGMIGHAWYPDKKATYALIRAGNFLPPRDYGTRHEDTVPSKLPAKAAFLYSEFGCIVDDLISQYGRDKLLAYLKALLNESDDLRLFRATFGQDFDDYLAGFRRRVELSDAPDHSANTRSIPSRISARASSRSVPHIRSSS